MSRFPWNMSLLKCLIMTRIQYCSHPKKITINSYDNFHDVSLAQKSTTSDSPYCINLARLAGHLFILSILIYFQCPHPPSLLCYKVNRVRTWLILLLPYKKHKKSRSLEAFFLTNDPFVIPCYSSFTPQVKPQHFQNLCPAYHFIL